MQRLKAIETQQADLFQVLGAVCGHLNELLSQKETTNASTPQSTGGIDADGNAFYIHPGGIVSRTPPTGLRGSHPDPGAAEPERQAPAGPEPAGGERERS
jgi:hypothetical protein